MADTLSIGKQTHSIPSTPFYEDTLNERADRTCTSCGIHSKQSVQTLWMFGGCITRWELVTWALMLQRLLSYWTWSILINIVHRYCLFPPFCSCPSISQHYMMNMLFTLFDPGHRRWTFFKKKSDLMRYVFEIPSTVWSHANCLKPDLVDNDLGFFESLMFATWYWFAHG